MKLLHFADAHIDMANYGRHDPESGLPLRVLDFLKSLDTIVQAAIDEKVDLVIFAGDAYKDRSPAPTFQREWGRRIIRLSQARIPTLLLVGNHDLSPAAGRAHAVHEYETLQVPFVRVLAKPELLQPADLWNLPAQVIAWPWISHSGIMAARGLGNTDREQVNGQIEDIIVEQTHEWLDQADPSLPLILTAHASVQGARYGSERTVMLGSDLVLPMSLVADPRFAYTALGHIHKPQDLNQGHQPPVIYPGSIERVDFGEAADDRFFVVAEIEGGETKVQWRKLAGARKFIERKVVIDADGSMLEASAETVTERLKSALPQSADLDSAIVKLTVEYPREYEALIDEAALRQHAAGAFEFHLVKRPQSEARVRLPADQTVGSLSPLDLLSQYWRASKVDAAEAEALQRLAAQLISREAEDEGST